MWAVRMERVERHFGGVTVLAGVDLRLAAGTWLGLRGRNGAGKSTLLRLLAGLLEPSAGSVRVGGLTPREAVRRGWIGWVGSEPGLVPRLTLRANLELAAGWAGMGRGRARTRVRQIAGPLGFADHLEVAAMRCSTGLRQRAALARALLARPRLLLLDEPLRGVDAASLVPLVRWLRKTHPGVTAIWVSHRDEVLAAGCDRCVELVGGRIAALPVPATERAA